MINKKGIFNIKSEEEKFKHAIANHLCHEVLYQLRVAEYLADTYDIVYNQFKPGLILKFIYKEDTAPDYRGLREAYRKAGIIEYFDLKLFTKTIHIYLKKEYVNKLEELMVIFKMQGIY